MLHSSQERYAKSVELEEARQRERFRQDELNKKRMKGQINGRKTVKAKVKDAKSKMKRFSTALIGSGAGNEEENVRDGAAGAFELELDAARQAISLPVSGHTGNASLPKKNRLRDKKHAAKQKKRRGEGTSKIDHVIGTEYERKSEILESGKEKLRRGVSGLIKQQNSDKTKVSHRYPMQYCVMIAHLAKRCV